MLGIGVWRGVISQCVVRRPALSAFLSGRRQSLYTAPACRAAGRQEVTVSTAFDPSVLQFLVCPLSRKALRFDESTNELVNDDLGIAYPIIDGIPNMIAQDARMIHNEQESKESPNTEQ
ncbi:protein preY, mitochondrial [Leptodactylus fuscus]